MSKRRYQQLSADEQRAIVAEYGGGAEGASIGDIAKQRRLPKSTVHAVIRRAELNHGDPVTERGHKQRKLNNRQAAKLLRTLDADPYATNRDLAAAVCDAIKPRTVSDYLARAEPAFSSKVVQDQEPEERTEDWKAAARRWVDRVRDIPLSRRVYADETPVYANEAPRKGRSRKGKPIFRARPRWAKKYTLHVFAGQTGVVHWELCQKNADTEEVERVAAVAAGEMKEGDVLIWDRLGRSGRAKHPVAQHYSPVALAAFRGHGARVEYLPPKGKYFNPLELLFNDLKSHYIRPSFPRNGEKLTYEQISALIQDYMQNKAPSTLPGFFRARANGAHAIAKQLL
jgi:transposase